MICGMLLKIKLQRSGVLYTLGEIIRFVYMDMSSSQTSTEDILFHSNAMIKLAQPLDVNAMSLKSSYKIYWTKDVILIVFVLLRIGSISDL